MFAIHRFVLQNSEIAGDLAQTDEAHLAGLSAGALGLSVVESAGDHNNCLIHSLAQALQLLGFISFDEQDRRGLCQSVRAYLCQDVTSRLHPRTAAGRIDAEAYLQHHLHADEVVRKLHELVGTDEPLPLDGFLLTVHARYDTAASPLKRWW